MNGTMGRRKIVWCEGPKDCCVVATPAGESAGFLKFILADGRELLLRRESIIKIEEVSQ